MINYKFNRNCERLLEVLGEHNGLTAVELLERILAKGYPFSEKMIDNYLFKPMYNLRRFMIIRKSGKNAKTNIYSINPTVEIPIVDVRQRTRKFYGTDQVLNIIDHVCENHTQINTDFTAGYLKAIEDLKKQFGGF